MTRRRPAPRDPRSDAGWVLVPVMALLVVAIGLGFALLAVVDQQTSASRQQRVVDSAQTLAEGVVAATTSVMASDPAPATWARTGGCRTITGDLVGALATTAPTDPDQNLAWRVAREVRSTFTLPSSSDLVASGGRSTTWAVSVCPVQGSAATGGWEQQTEARWSDGMLTRTVAQPAGTGPARASMWVRGRATVATTRTGGQAALDSRAVVTKIRQSASAFRPPAGYAVGAAGFSTDLGTTLSQTLLQNDSLVGGLLGKTLGTKPLIGSDGARIGTRCGLLNSLNNLNSVCLSGTLAGAGSATRSLALGQLNTILGVETQAHLSTWTMAPKDAQAGYEAASQSPGGIHKGVVAGAGSTRSRTAPASTPECLTEATDATTVVWIDQVGDGDQYCTLSGTRTARMIVVARGGVRITGRVNGVVYALNRQECAAATCTDGDRRTAAAREVVRIEGNEGRVVGAVWADGAGGQVGIHPALSTPSGGALLAVGDAQTGICGLPVLGPLLQGLSTTLTGVLDAVGNLLGGLAGSQQQVRYVDASGAVLASPPSNCDLLKNTLGQLTASSLLDLFGSGGTKSTTITERRTRSCVLLVCGAWSGWSARDTVTFTVPALLTSALPTVVSQVTGLLTSTLSNYQAVTLDPDAVSNATASITQGAGPVPGSYANTAASAGP